MEVPTESLDMSSWNSITCYPRRTYYNIIDGTWILLARAKRAPPCRRRHQPITGLRPDPAAANLTSYHILLKVCTVKISFGRLLLRLQGRLSVGQGFIFLKDRLTGSTQLIICFLWIGAQLPQEIFISSGRILTLLYYFIILSISTKINIS